MAITRAFLNSQRYDEAKGGINQTNKLPIVINGDMAVAQRGNQTGKTAACYTAADRFYFNAINLGTWSLTQDTDNPGFGFAHSLKYDCTSADASPASADNLYLSMQTELRNLQMMRKGTASAKTSTVAFWVKCTKTGNFVVELWDRPNDRHVGKVVTINVADTWEKKIVNFPADTSGTLSSSNARSIMMSFAFDAGSNFTSGTLPSAWGSRSDANRFVGTTLALGDNTDNNLFITGIQWEMGTYDSETMPPFQFEDGGSSLARCQRYCFLMKASTTYTRYAHGIANSTTQAEGVVNFPVSMRGAPTLTTSGTAAEFACGDGAALVNCNSVPIVGNASTVNPGFQDIFFPTAGSLTQTEPYALQGGNNTNTFLLFESEI